MICPSRRAALVFTDVPAGSPVTLPHHQPTAPIFKTRNNAVFTVTANGTSVTVTNTGVTAGTCAVYLFYFSFGA